MAQPVAAHDLSGAQQNVDLGHHISDSIKPAARQG